MMLVSLVSPLYTTRLINSPSSPLDKLVSDFAKRVVSKETEGRGGKDC